MKKPLHHAVSLGLISGTGIVGESSAERTVSRVASIIAVMIPWSARQPERARGAAIAAGRVFCLDRYLNQHHHTYAAACARLPHMAFAGAEAYHGKCNLR